MNPFVTAALLMCTTGDPVVADRIAQEAVLKDTDMVVAVTIGIMESGLHPGNPMGVMGCYPAAKKRYNRSTNDCISIGVQSIHNRLWDAKVTKPTKMEIKSCAGSGNITMCRALITYNNADRGRKYTYAKRAMGIIRKIYQLVGDRIPSV